MCWSLKKSQIEYLHMKDSNMHSDQKGPKFVHKTSNNFVLNFSCRKLLLDDPS